MAHEINRDASTSDDDSLSLLCNLDACRSRGDAEDMEVGDFDPPVGNEEQKKELEVDINQVKALESGISSCTQSAAGCGNSTSQLGNYKLEIPETSWYDSALLPP